MAPSFREVRVSGGPFQRGRQHGDQADDLIAASLEHLIDGLASGQRTPDPTGSPAATVRERILARTLDFLPGLEQFAPHLVEEIRGVAAGARISFAEALLCNVRGEVGERLTRNGAESREGACTAFAVGRSMTADGGMLAGQNSDQGAWARDLMIVLVATPERGPAAMMCTHAGLIGYHGFNSAGVAQFANAVPFTGWRRAMPHYLMKRVLLEQDSVRGCLDVLRAARVASPGNYVLADRAGRVTDVELTPQGAHVVEPADDFAIHANHYEHPSLVGYNPAGERLAGSTCRTARLARILQENRGHVTVGTMKRALSDHVSQPCGICRHGYEDSYTVASMIAELDHGRMHVSRGSPCENGYTTYCLP